MWQDAYFKRTEFGTEPNSVLFILFIILMLLQGGISYQLFTGRNAKFTVNIFILEDFILGNAFGSDFCCWKCL